VFKSDFQGVRLKKAGGCWRIYEIHYSVPENIIHPSNETERHQNLFYKEKSVKDNIDTISNPYASFILPTNIQPF